MFSVCVRKKLAWVCTFLFIFYSFLSSFLLFSQFFGQTESGSQLTSIITRDTRTMAQNRNVNFVLFL